MAAIALSDCSVYRKHEGEVEVAYIKTPSTADSADTIDITGLLNGRSIADLYAWDVTSEILSTATSSSGVVTLDAAGGTTDHVYVLKVAMLR